MISFGEALVLPSPMASAACFDSVIDFCERGKMPPPFDSFLVS
jgi:hypothetical protein